MSLAAGLQRADGMRVLVVDNYDSFTYNLVQYLGELGAELEVVRNDHATVDELLIRGYDRVIVSPGPCTPNQAGITLEVVRRFPEARDPDARGLPRSPGARAGVGREGHPSTSPCTARRPMIEHDGRTIFRGLSPALEVGRYHSLIAAAATSPSRWSVSASADGIVMAVRHRSLPAEGVQFHPESVLTEQGKELLSNFLNAAR